MKGAVALTLLASYFAGCSSLAVPEDAQRRSDHAESHFSPAAYSYHNIFSRSLDAFWPDLAKRRGGGGRGGGGFSSGGSSSGGSSGGSSSGGRSGSSSSGSSSGGSTGGRSGSTSTSPSFGPGGRTFAGGSSSSYRAGGRSPSGISPVLLGAGVGLGIGALALYPALAWPHGAYSYPYGHGYSHYNNTLRRQQDLPVTCLCDPYQPCGCDDPGDNSSAAIAQFLGNGTARIVRNGSQDVVLINGTLPNGTDDGSSPISGASGGWARTLLEGAGYWQMLLVVGLMVWM